MTDRIDYVLFGVRLDYSPERYDWDVDDAELEMEPNREFDLIVDGMSGEYIYAGKILAQTDQYEGFEPTVIPDELDMGTWATAIMTRWSDVKLCDFKLHVFSHFS